MSHIAIDLGGSHAVCALVDQKGVIGSQCIPIGDNSSLAAVLPLLEPCVAGLLQRAERPACRGLMFSFCGIVDTASKSIVTTNGKYLDAHTIDLAAWSSRCFGLAFEIENDARAALLGEWVAGSARGCNDFVMATLGTGVGGAAMMGGQVLRGKHSQAGCLLGHFGSDAHGHACSCGNRGCVEAEASTWALDRLCREHSSFCRSPLAQINRITFQDVMLHAQGGDLASIAIRDRCTEIWSAAAVSWIHAYDPELIVFGGGIMEEGDALLSAIERHIEQHAWTPWGKVSVRKAQLGNLAPMYAGIVVFGEGNEK